MKVLEPEVTMQGRPLVDKLWLLKKRPGFRQFEIQTYTKRTQAVPGGEMWAREGKTYWVDLETVDSTVYYTLMHGPLPEYRAEYTQIRLPLPMKGPRWRYYIGDWDKYSNGVVAIRDPWLPYLATELRYLWMKNVGYGLLARKLARARDN